MSFKSSLIKIAIKLTPNIVIIWVANIILKGIAELADFNFDIDTRSAYVKIQLLGEAEAIEVWLEDIAIISDEGSYQFILHQAQSNKLWLSNLLAHITGRTWKIPVPPQFAAHFELVAELFKPESTAQTDNLLE